MESQKKPESENIEPSVCYIHPVRPSYYGYICVASSDFGEKIGLTKQMAYTATIGSDLIDDE
jgi:DNA-directed RNA polymerase beta subunit